MKPGILWSFRDFLISDLSTIKKIITSAWKKLSEFKSVDLGLDQECTFQDTIEDFDQDICVSIA